MSFLFGKSGSESNVDPNTEALQRTLAKYLKGRGFEGLFAEPGVDPNVIQPYLDLFTQQNSKNLAQAKESTGNLTGSGVGNIIGQQAGRASTEQGAFLADLSERMRQADKAFLLNAILGTLGSPAAGRTQTYTPGFLDYATSAAGKAAGAAGGGGGAARAAPAPVAGPTSGPPPDYNPYEEPGRAFDPFWQYR
jgi:hypothetical protein